MDLNGRKATLKRFVVALAFAGALALGGATAAVAAPNPSGTGQPGAECGEPNASVEPAGFGTSGFAHAETVYAGSGASAAHANSPHAVSQYDVACYQLTSNAGH
jgi:hypothetical protein